MPSNQDHSHFRRTFLALYGVTSLLIALVALPFSEPDGYVHWWRMLALAQGQVLPESTDEGDSGIAVQVSDGELKERLAPFITRANIKVWPKGWIAMVAITDQQAETVQYEGAGAFASAPLLYAIPTVLAAGADWLVASEYGAVLAYRVFFVLLSLMIIGWLLPSSPFAVAAFCSVPMVQFLVATGHMDAVVLLALMSAGALAGRRPRWLPLPLLVLASKSAVALLAPFFLIAANGWRRGLLYSIPVLLIIGGAYFLYLGWMGPIVDGRIYDGVDPPGQLRALLDNPLAVIRIAASTLAHNSVFYLKTMVGVLGWLDAPIPLWAFVAVWLMGLAILLTHRVPRATLLAWLTTSALYCAATFAAIYLTWTPVGMTAVFGVQGRYFLPIFAAIVPLLVARYDLARFWMPALLLGGVLQVQTLYTVAERYYHLDRVPLYFSRLIELWI